MSKTLLRFINGIVQGFLVTTLLSVVREHTEEETILRMNAYHVNLAFIVRTRSCPSRSSVRRDIIAIRALSSLLVAIVVPFVPKVFGLNSNVNQEHLMTNITNRHVSPVRQDTIARTRGRLIHLNVQISRYPVLVKACVQNVLLVICVAMVLMLVTARPVATVSMVITGRAQRMVDRSYN